jgi:hypothetical protein
MIPPSACPSWQPDIAANAAQEHHSYTTSRDTIPATNVGQRQQIELMLPRSLVLAAFEAEVHRQEIDKPASAIL